MRTFAILVIGSIFVSGICSASSSFDIFGVDDKTKQLIKSSCSNLISKHKKYISKIFTSFPNPSPQQLLYKEKLEQRLITNVRQLNQFSLAKISTVYYPVDKKVFITLDLVKSEDKSRLPKQKSKTPVEEHTYSQDINKLFSIWYSYLERKYDLIRKNKLDFSKTSCPVSHCIWGFDNQDLKTTLPQIQQGVFKHKSELKDIIKNSPNDHKRQEAIFILAHDNNYQELAKFLINFTDDSSEGVRNNVMRVLGAIVAKHDIKGLDIKRILTALNYPFVTDRNKAAYVLFGIVKHDPSKHQQIINSAGNTLLELLKLQQPNNHDFAYKILKVISKKTYGERDYVSWHKWIHSQQ